MITNSPSRLARFRFMARIQLTLIGPGLDAHMEESPFTCDKCDISYRCPYAYDLYNIYGECLEEK